MEAEFSKIEYTSFVDECDLLAKVEETLRGKRKPQKPSLFKSEVEKLIPNEGLEIKQTNKPLIEIVIGSTTETEEWLLSNSQNNFLIYVFSYCRQVEVMRKFLNANVMKKYSTKFEQMDFSI